jgi:RNA polymerase sigma-70 factor (ECF subfamily)
MNKEHKQRMAGMIDACSADLSAEADLIERARTDAEAFGRLYDEHLPSVYAFLYRRCRSHQDTEDLTAHTFHRALERLDTFEWRELPFRAWLFRIARNALIDYYRRDRGPLSLDGLGEAGFEPPGDDGRALDSALVRDEQLDTAWAAVADLPPMQRRAVTLYFAHGLSHAEVGRTIGRSEAATKQMVYRAVKALRLRLANEED